MSSLLNSLDMSLDDLIDKKKSANKSGRDARGGGGGGPVRRNRPNTGRGRRNAEPYSRKNDSDDDMGDSSGKSGKRASILSRLGGRVSNDDAGHKIFVQNLKFDVLEDDLKELFGTVGKVTKAEIVYDKSGRSKGLARVWFARRNDAEQAVKRYDGRLLDDQALKIALDDAPSSGGGYGNPRNTSSSQRRSNNDGNNVRQGVFGTALDDNDEPSGGRRGGGGGRRRRGGRGGGIKSAKDLDNDMDTYNADS
ncbi:hypothetical protein, variant 1 [Aphanomyces invadans]|uniref:RRM domain-containing protein n=1 Tax=Aphanomyces invadans TaxID=157072 RepID=A0A024UVC9_9STRA|nr:hypothetical protein, variant 1 [Aphanomyces invadans]ETW09613.1 hypothetical protein, variant 1 [Aphanomyces invadans]|eukprot:XP_008861024.1 hypothetical protein, variant 1 [Aphanomyces invadans]